MEITLKKKKIGTSKCLILHRRHYLYITMSSFKPQSHNSHGVKKIRIERERESSSVESLKCSLWEERRWRALDDSCKFRVILKNYTENVFQE